MTAENLFKLVYEEQDAPVEQVLVSSGEEPDDTPIGEEPNQPGANVTKLFTAMSYTFS